MRINYPSRSRFLWDCEKAISKNKNALFQCVPITISFAAGGYNAKIRATIEKTNSMSFQTDWTSSDKSRFPVRIKAAAYALFRQGCYGDYLMSHYSGTVTIRYLISSPVINRKEKNEYFQTSEKSEGKTIKSTSKKKSIYKQLTKEHLVDILKNIPWKTWNEIVMREPEWYNLESFLEEFDCGSFSVFMLAVGLNAYALKQRAEETYWPELHNLLKKSEPITSLKGLYELLKSFYQMERVPTVKLRRLERFLYSPLARGLWQESPQDISRDFKYVWISLAKTMKQDPKDKTICFAMKCLGISLLMEKEYRFDFAEIPIPVDSRVILFTQKSGISTIENNKLIQDTWSEILSRLRPSIPDLTMIHLDSLIWQIASLSGDELDNYFISLGIPDIGRDLLPFLQNDTSALNRSAQIKMKENNKVLRNGQSEEKKILIMFPCSKSKNSYVDRETFNEYEEKQVIDYIENTQHLLTSGRKEMSSYIYPDSIALCALDRYNGHLYNSTPDFRNSVKGAFGRNNVHILIMSGAFGVVTPSERILDYDKLIDVKFWIQHGLPKVIEEYIERNGITHVFGFFSKTTDYIKIMRSVDWKRLEEIANLQLSRIYYINYQGSGRPDMEVPQKLGKLIISFINSGFNQEHFYEDPFEGQSVDFISHIEP